MVLSYQNKDGLTRQDIFGNIVGNVKGGESKVKIDKNQFYIAGQRSIERGDADIVIVEAFDHVKQNHWCHIMIGDRSLAESIVARTGWKEESRLNRFTRLYAPLSEEGVRCKLGELGFHDE